MSAPEAISVPPKPINISSPVFSNSTSSDSLWDRISNWASENKAVVYTIAGVTLVITGAGVYYYLSSEKSQKPSQSPSTKKKSKNRKKAKKDDEVASKTDASSKVEPQAASVTSGDLPADLDELTEDVIASLSEQVH
jgi:mitochondrial import receptor subunit TOM70